ncbi:hypothetical protein BH11BAC1_BH11BAC1_01650 [soil metagenome]
MKKLFTICLFFLLLRIFPSAQTQTASVAHHPEKGILPFNAPCQDCEEDLAKRSSDTREFFKMEHGSKTIYMQRSLGAMNFRDENGYWRTIDPVLKKEGEFVFGARQQPAPVLIDLENKFASITNAGKEFRFNKNLSLSHVSATGIITNLGEGNYNNVSELINFTESTILVHDFYRGIDLQLISGYGRIETSFIIKDKLKFADGWLILNQQLEIPEGLQSDLSQSAPAAGNRRSGSILISDLNDKNYFYFKAAHAYDAHESFQNYIDMSFSLQSDKLSYFVPLSWLNDEATIYPVVIDPFVSTSDSLPEASITGSGFTAQCDTAGCSYFINNFNVPPDCQITEIATYYSYVANLPCVRDDGGFGITMTTPLGSCSTRHFTCLGGVQGACFFWPAMLLYAVPPLSLCLPPPQCASYSVDFEMKFRRCNQLPMAGCDATCVLANSPWIMTVTGRTVEMTNVSLSHTICQGGCTNIAASADWGVEPYTFLWTPGNIVGDAINVCPANTTSYLVTVNDACGITVTDSTTISVTNGQSPGFDIFPNDSVCGGTQLTFTANSTDPDSLFSWIINCQSIDTIDSTKIVSYAAPAVPTVCTATMLYHVTDANGSCAFTSVDTFYVMTGSSPVISISGPDSVCQGTASTYIANYNFGGTIPSFQWYLNGNIIPGADSASYTGVFSNGEELVVSMTSSDSCSLGITVYDTIQTSIASYILPDVAIHTIVDTICSGYVENFTMSTHNFGINPRRLWFQNGVLADSGSSFTTTVYYDDEIVAMLIAGLTCPVADTVTDTSTVIVLPLTGPIVDISISDDTVCAGDTIVFTSTVSNVAIPPSYRWYLNGNFAGLNSTYTSYSLTSSDVLVLLIFTPNPCGPDSATDTVSVVVNPITGPGVSLIGSDTICSGDTLSLSAATVNGGVAPQFEWFVNGILLGTDSVFSSSTIVNGDSLWVTMMSSDACSSPDSTADSTIITVVPSVIPVVLLSASDDTICQGDPVTFIAMPTGAGAAPSYQWMLNGITIAAAMNSTYTTSSLMPGDVISVVVTSSAACSDPDTASNSIAIVVENCLGIDKPSQSVFSLHPNPATDEVVVDFNSSGFNMRNILIYDALGRILLQEMNVDDKKFHIDISAFSPSIYFVKVIEAEKEYLQKLVVE